MRKQRIKRIAGYMLWAVALVVLLPPTLVSPAHELVNGHLMFLFTLMVAMLLGGYALIDSANSSLRRLSAEK